MAAYEHDATHTRFDIGGVSVTLVISPDEIEWTAVRAQGAGGQNVNKVATAVQMRFDIRASSLPEPEKELLLQLQDRRITDEGVIVIKAQQFRTQERNKEQALAQLEELVRRATIVHKKRRPTRPTPGAKRKRLEQKQQRGQVKTLRSKPRAEDEGCDLQSGLQNECKDAARPYASCRGFFVSSRLRVGFSNTLPSLWPHAQQPQPVGDHDQRAAFVPDDAQRQGEQVAGDQHREQDGQGDQSDDHAH